MTLFGRWDNVVLYEQYMKYMDFLFNRLSALTWKFDIFIVLDPEKGT